MKLIGNRIYAECIKPKEKTETGIFLPENHILENNRAIVKFVGPKVEYFAPGDVLQYDPNFGIKHTHEGKNGVFIKEDQHDLFKI